MGADGTAVAPEEFLRAAFRAAVEAADPERCLPRFLPDPPRGRTVVVGAGKAAAAMARSLEAHWDAPLVGAVVTAAGHALPCERIAILEASHPLPEEAGRRAALRMLELVTGLVAEDLVICLLSGGGSALMPLPQPGLELAAKQRMTRDLLQSGASIAAINCVRRHLSLIKGGRLAAAAAPARVVTLAISDVPGDSPVDIASGPTVADPTSCADALAVLVRHGIEAPPAVVAALSSGAWESVKPADARLANADYRIIAAPVQSLEAAAALARTHGIEPRILSDRVEGEAREVGRAMAALAIEARRTISRPCLLLSGGETTVTVRGKGRGGRNVEFLLGFGLALGSVPGVHAIACDTDGVDGMEPVAGALWRPDTLGRAAARGLDPAQFLADNDAHSFFGALGDSVVTGPTRTNVNDFRAILLLPSADRAR